MLLSSKNRFRLAASAALVLGAAVNANAWIITFSGSEVNGVANNTAGLLNTSYEFSDLLTGPFSITDPGASLSSGQVTFMTAGMPMQMLTLNYTATSTVTAGGTTSIAGTWTLVPGSAMGVNVGPTGTQSSSFDTTFTSGAAGTYSMSFVGTATPEPAPFAAMGIGIIGLCVSRRRKLRG